VLLAAFAAQAVTSLRVKVVTVDEITYIATGYHHLETGSFRMNRTNPPLLKVLSAAPLRLLGLELPPVDGDPATWSEVPTWRYARSFLYDNRVAPERILLWARLPMVGLGLLLGVFVHRWAARVYGARAALLALFLYALSPNVLAHTRLATQDLGLAAFTFIGAYAFWEHARTAGLGSLLLAGLAFAAAFLSKTTALFLVPVVVAALVVPALLGRAPGCFERLPGGRPVRDGRAGRLQSVAASGAALVAVAVVGLNAGYAFEGSFESASDRVAPESVLERIPGADVPLVEGVVRAGMEVPLPLPAGFLEVLRFQAGRVRAGNNVYFAGETSREGWWYVTPVAFLVKTPLPVLALVGVAGVQLARSRRWTDAELTWVLVVATCFALFTVLKSVAVGLRYVLPVFPFLHVLASRVLRDGARLERWRGAALAALCVWLALSTWRIHPHYLAYFNELVGPSNGYRLLADSNLDWGQDLGLLAAYLEEQGIDRIRLAYFGSADARHHGIDYEYLPSVGLAPRDPGDRWWYEVDPEALPPLDPTRGPLAVSASLLAGVFYPGYYAPLREQEPVAQIGHSILIYDPAGELGDGDLPGDGGELRPDAGDRPEESAPR